MLPLCRCRLATLIRFCFTYATAAEESERISHNVLHFSLFIFSFYSCMDPTTGLHAWGGGSLSEFPFLPHFLYVLSCLRACCPSDTEPVAKLFLCVAWEWDINILWLNVLTLLYHNSHISQFQKRNKDNYIYIYAFSNRFYPKRLTKRLKGV